jgi:hypothetical protein
MQNKVFITLFYLVLSFSVFFSFEFKDSFWQLLYFLLVISLVLNFLNKKNIFSLLILFFTLFLSSTILFGNFIIDIIYKPTILALNCEGELPMNGNWIKGYLLGIFISVLMLIFYLKKIKYNIIKLERIYSIILIFLLLMSIILNDDFKNLHIYIKQFSIPVLIYPEGC